MCQIYILVIRKTHCFLCTYIDNTIFLVGVGRVLNGPFFTVGHTIVRNIEVTSGELIATISFLELTRNK